MNRIHILDSETIDKIAAGEVVERPSSVVKELVENAIDAGATAITVEAKEGGIEFLRVTDNGSGMEKAQLKTAFLRHATSKISDAEDLLRISSLGFRGEALSSIAAVSRVEVITRVSGELTGVRYVLDGGCEKAFEEIGAPEGTTFIMRNLFFNTPVRRKFLKQPATEGGYIADLMEHLALSRPDISFKFVLGGQVKFHTSGNGDLKEVIYRIYGREIAASLIPIRKEVNGISIEGYLGKPNLVRSNRNFEIYFINGRFIKSQLLSKAIEEGYREYLMQHKFPLCVLQLAMDTEAVDVNVHPTKMDVRFSDAPFICNQLSCAVREALGAREMIPQASLSTEKELLKERRQLRQEEEKQARKHTPEPFELSRREEHRVMEASRYQAAGRDRGAQPAFASPAGMAEKHLRKEEDKSAQLKGAAESIAHLPVGDAGSREELFFVEAAPETEKSARVSARESKSEAPQQLNLFEEKLLSHENRSRYRMIGQVFGTYWLVQCENEMMIIDQHAAHEKVKYERLMKQYREHQVLSQSLLPPVIVSLTGQEEAVLSSCQEVFAALGFEVEAFGGSEYALRSVPVELYGCSERALFCEVLDALLDGSYSGRLKSVEEKIASMSCKAAVKGNHVMSQAEAQELIDELLTLENPYNCPHGRPTIISMSRTELEKKFKRIV